MKKLYKVYNGKQILKLLAKGKIKNQLIVVDFGGIECIGLFIGLEHYSTGQSMLVSTLLSNNTFYIYENNDENYNLVEPKCRQYNSYFRK